MSESVESLARWLVDNGMCEDGPDSTDGEEKAALLLGAFVINRRPQTFLVHCSKCGRLLKGTEAKEGGVRVRGHSRPRIGSTTEPSGIWCVGSTDRTDHKEV